MPNYCYNEVKFSGPTDAILKTRLCFLQIAESGAGLPDMVAQGSGNFFEVTLKDDSINYLSRNVPNTSAVAQVAEYFGLDYKHYYEELNVGLIGEVTRNNGNHDCVRRIDQDSSLIAFDPACEQFLYNGKYYDYEPEIWMLQFHEKKALAASETFKQRIAGKLPYVAIAGTDFTIDWENRKLIETGSPDNFLEIGLDALNKNGNMICFFYDRNNRKLVNGSHAIQTLPPEVCIIDLPDFGHFLDPVAAARELGLYDTDLLLVHPYHDQQVAGVTEIQDLIRQQTGYRNSR